MALLIPYTIFTTLSVLIMFSHTSFSIVSWTRSHLHLLLCLNVIVNILCIVARQLQKQLLGDLRASEFKHIQERILNFALFKMVFIGAVVDPDFREVLVWSTWFIIMGFLRIGSLLARVRFESISVSPSTPSQTYKRLITFLLCIICGNVVCASMCLWLFSEASWSVLLLLLFECAMLGIESVQTLVRFMLHLSDHLHTDSSWETRTTHMFYIELGTELLLHLCSILHYLHIWATHGLSFTLVDVVLFLNVRAVLKHIRKHFQRLRNYRQAMNDMDTRYPSATAEELEANNDNCAICRDRMTSARKLPCSHLFHLNCLRQWLEHEHTCPICRTPLLRPPSTSGTAPTGPAAAAPNPPPNPRATRQHVFRFRGNRLFSWLPNFSFSIIHGRRHPSPQLLGMIASVQEIFPHISTAVIAEDLVRTQNVAATISNILEGVVQIVPTIPLTVPTTATTATRPDTNSPVPTAPVATTTVEPATPTALAPAAAASVEPPVDSAPGVDSVVGSAGISVGPRESGSPSPPVVDLPAPQDTRRQDILQALRRRLPGEPVDESSS
eukprot:GILJ01011913.1.p1 GENE.GILJ01011913.1~~GILJ01011913.1.p1  ORF type:complete len:566 (+),score=48.10 GILJ01011913.1:34-1698(+)